MDVCLDVLSSPMPLDRKRCDHKRLWKLSEQCEYAPRKCNPKNRGPGKCKNKCNKNAIKQMRKNATSGNVHVLQKQISRSCFFFCMFDCMFFDFFSHFFFAFFFCISFAFFLGFLQFLKNLKPTNFYRF